MANCVSVMTGIVHFYKLACGISRQEFLGSYRISDVLCQIILIIHRYDITLMRHSHTNMVCNS